MKRLLIAALLLTLLCLPAQALETFPPASHPLIRGLDVSAWQGEIDWARVAQAGMEIVYIRATEGDRYEDAYFRQNYVGAKENGLQVGVYHFLTAQNAQEARAQARFFVETLRAADAVPDCRPALDLEGDAGMSDALWNEIAAAFLQEVEALSGYPPCIYSDASGARDRYSAALAIYPLWVANYGVAEPEANGKWASWAGFQCSDRGTVAGVSGNVDLDFFTRELLLSAPEPSPQPTPAPTENAVAYYQVQRGDSLESAADAYHASAEAVRQMNILPTKGLLPGQVLRIPAPAGNGGDFASLFVSPNRTRPRLTAAHFGVPGDDLAGLNFFPQQDTVLRGQILKIPTRTAASPLSAPDTLLDYTYIVQQDDSLAAVASAFSLDEARLASFNGLKPGDRIWPGQILHLTAFGVPTQAEGFYGAYVVQKGDTLTRIARRFSVTVDDLVAVNDLPVPSLLVLGQVLIIPE